MATAPKVNFTPELQQIVLDRLEGGESLRAICRDEGMPEISQVMRFRRTDETFATQYAHAREIQAEVLADEIMEIADYGVNDTYVVYEADSEDGKSEPTVRTDHDVIARSRLRVDTRKWFLSKVLPKVYGDKVTQEHTGEVTQRVIRGDL